MAPGLRQFTERRGDCAGEPLLDNENGEDLMYVQPGVSIVIGNRSPESQGTVYISTKKVVWLSDVDRTKGYSVDFLSPSLHAVSREPEAYSSPCIYTQIEAGDESEDSDSECNDALDLSKVTEMRLVPSDPGQLDTLFQILCECAELNPEPIKDNEEHNWIFSADQLVDEFAEGEDSEWKFSQNPSSSIGRSNGDHDLARTVLELQISDNRFEDAEEMEHEHDRDGGHYRFSLYQTSSGSIFMHIFLLNALKFTAHVNLFSKYLMIGWKRRIAVPFYANLPSNMVWCIVKTFNAVSTWD